jgi:hypothetical protein
VSSALPLGGRAWEISCDQHRRRELVPNRSGRAEGFLRAFVLSCFPASVPQFLIDTLAIRNASNRLKTNDGDHF